MDEGDAQRAVDALLRVAQSLEEVLEGLSEGKSCTDGVKRVVEGVREIYSSVKDARFLPMELSGADFGVGCSSIAEHLGDIGDDELLADVVHVKRDWPA